MLAQVAQQTAIYWNWWDPTTSYQSADPTRMAGQVHAMIWDAAHGTRLLKDVLIHEHGLAHELSGWSLISASAISGDGNVIAGVGVNPDGEFQGWVVVIPEPGTFFVAVGFSAILVVSRTFLAPFRTGGRR
jgi:hypothetical protein